MNELLFQMMPLGAQLPLMRFSSQARYMEAVLHGTHSFIAPKKMDIRLSYLRICPKCFMQDIEKYGEAYYHACHHIPEMKVCPKHGEPFRIIPMECAGEITGMKTLPRTDREETVSNMTAEILRSRFLMMLYTEAPCTEPLEFLNLIKEKHKESGLSQNEGYCMIRNRYGTGCSFKDRDHFEQFLYKQVRDTMCLLEAAETFLNEKDIQSCKEKHREALIPMLKENGYELLSDFGQIVKLRCGRGHVFHIHPYAVRMGFGCPECDREIPPLDFANRLLSHLGDGRYHTDSIENGLKKCKIIHDTCGGTRMGFSDIVFGEKKCKCETTFSLEEYQNMFDRKRKEFVAEKFVEDPSGRKMRIRHKKCGAVFDVKPAYFIPHPYCRVCNPRYIPRMAADQDIEELTGREYARISPYKGYRDKIKVRHETCGTWFEITPDGFREGYRCPLCSPSSWPEEYVRKSISQCTGGLYEEIGFKRDTVTVKCVDGTVFRKTRSCVMQELMRPTPSKVFRFRESLPERLESNRLAVFNRAKAVCEEQGKWKAEDVPGVSYSARKSICRWLHDNGYLIRVAKGVYIMGEKTRFEGNNDVGDGENLA